MKTIMTLLIFLTSQNLLAGDASYYTSLGFSKDGKHYAYTQEGVQDGSGAYWIELGIINVNSNKYIGRARIGGEYEDGGFTSDHQGPAMLMQLKRQLNFGQFDFPHKPLQETLIKRQQKDLSLYINSTFSLDYWVSGGASRNLPSYELILDEVKAPITESNEWCADWYENSMIKLSLKYDPTYDKKGADQKVLQSDQFQPELRNCSFGYSIREVHHEDGGLAVVIKFRTPGFEGPNERYMVVTGRL